MPTSRAAAYNTSYAMKDMEENMMNGAQALKWLTQTNGKRKMVQMSKPIQFFQVGRGVSLHKLRLMTLTI